MKNLMNLLTGVLLVSTLLMSCKKDEDDKKESKNYLKIGNTEYDLSAGILENYGIDDDESWHLGYNTDLTLYSKGLSLQTDDDDDWDLVGKGHGIYFEMFSTAGNALDVGDYNFSSSEPFPIGTFDAGEYVINYDSVKDDSEDESEIVSGKVSVSKSGSEYSITIDCTDENGKKITGFYKGTLQYFDWSDDFKSASLKSTKLKKNMLGK